MMNTLSDLTGNRGRAGWWRVSMLVLYLFTLAIDTGAHEGPPFPLIVDKQVGPYVVTVWTDPDIGYGTFFVVMEPGSGDDGPLPEPEVLTVEVGVEPVSGRLEETVYTAEPLPARRGARFTAEVEFDRGEMWKVRVRIAGPGWDEELRSEVEATPDGSVGPISILIYAIPFVGIAILWIRAIVIRRRGEEE